VGNAGVPVYKLCLEEIDEVAAVIVKIGSRNPDAYLRFMKSEARQFINQDNSSFKV